MKNNKQMKVVLKFLIFIGIFLFFCCSLFSQGRAGPDKYICPGSSVIIGSNGSGGECYHWSDGGDNNTLSNENSPSTPVYPEETTTYHLIIVGPNFEYREEDDVTVFVLEKISAEPLKCCYEEGDPISLNQFEVITTPPNFNTPLSIAPAVAEVPYVGMSGQQEVTITACENDNLSDEVGIQVVDPSIKINRSLSYSIQPFVDKVQHVNSKLKTGLSITMSGNGVKEDFKKCCPIPDCVTNAFTLGGNISASLTGFGNAPFPGLPIPGIYIISELSASISVIIPTGSWTKGCELMDELCFGVNTSYSLSVGLQILPDNKYFTAIGDVVGTITPPPYIFCLPQGQLEPQGAWCGDLQLRLRLRYISFTSFQKKNFVEDKRSLTILQGCF